MGFVGLSGSVEGWMLGYIQNDTGCGFEILQLLLLLLLFLSFSIYRIVKSHRR